VIRLRGYEDSALNPIGNNSMGYSRVYNKYTVELRYPLIMKPSSTIYGLVFAEGGNGFNSWKEFSPFKIKRSAGVGVRMYLPVVGMLGIDWAWGFDPAAGGTTRSGSQFHFMIGQQF
jgi:outer membrane protein insertion porin family